MTRLKRRLLGRIASVDKASLVAAIYICNEKVRVTFMHAGHILGATPHTELTPRLTLSVCRSETPQLALQTALNFIDSMAPEIEALEVAVSARFQNLSEKDVGNPGQYAKWADGPNESVWLGYDFYTHISEHFRSRATLAGRAERMPSVRISTDMKSAGTWESYWECGGMLADTPGVIITTKACTFSNVSDLMSYAFEDKPLRNSTNRLLPIAINPSGPYKGFKDPYYADRVRRQNWQRKALTFNQLTNLESVVDRHHWLRGEDAVSDPVSYRAISSKSDAYLGSAHYHGMMARILFEENPNISSIVPHGLVTSGNESPNHKARYLAAMRRGFDETGTFSVVGDTPIITTAPPASDVIRPRSHPNMVTLGALLRAVGQIARSSD